MLQEVQQRYEKINAEKDQELEKNRALLVISLRSIEELKGQNEQLQRNQLVEQEMRKMNEDLLGKCRNYEQQLKMKDDEIFGLQKEHHQCGVSLEMLKKAHRCEVEEVSQEYKNKLCQETIN